MNYRKLEQLNKDIFTPQDVAEALGIAYQSACVTASRYVQQGIFIRLKRNFYTLTSRWGRFGAAENFRVANILEVPSYISLTTALSFYGITTQMPRDFYESISIKRTKNIEEKERTFIFIRINKGLYHDFIKQDDYFIATPEKALLDALYLMSLNRYHLDISALDVGKLDHKKINKLVASYPEKTGKSWRQICGTSPSMKSLK